MSVVLGINDGFNATAAIAVDGRLVACAQEERFSRRKNQSGFPTQAARWCLRQAHVENHSQLDAVVMGGLIGHYPLNPTASAGIGLYGTLQGAFQSIEAALPATRAHQITSGAARRLLTRHNQEQRASKASFELRVERSKIHFEPHHRSHAAAALWFGLQPGTLIVTADGEGDWDSATVWLYTGTHLEQKAATNLHASLGNLWAAATSYLKMTPHEHEYKLMGLAPYADPERSLKASARFYELLTTQDLGFAARHSTRMSLRWIERNCKDLRFDVFSGALQAYTEQLLQGWVELLLHRFDCAHLALGGGVFMNVKANGRLAAIPGLQSFTPVPGSGDESLAMGAIASYLIERKEPISRLSDLYLGPSYSPGVMRLAAEGADLVVTEPEDPDEAAADLLAEGQIVARFSGRMEFGARALGNRSLLADPSRKEAVATLNHQIKNRDFWMPFASSVLASHSADYLIKPFDFPAPHMMVTFETTPLGRQKLIAGIHPSDHTVRPQEVSANSSYARLITAFAARTGIHAVLNTSLNLHGEPVVMSPEDAISTLRRSSLQHLQMGPFLVSKKEAAAKPRPRPRGRNARRMRAAA